MLSRPRAHNVEQLLRARNASVRLFLFAEVRNHPLQQTEGDHDIKLRALDAVDRVHRDAASVLEYLAKEVDLGDVGCSFPPQTFDLHG